MANAGLLFITLSSICSKMPSRMRLFESCKKWLRRCSQGRVFVSFELHLLLKLQDHQVLRQLRSIPNFSNRSVS